MHLFWRHGVKDINLALKRQRKLIPSITPLMHYYTVIVREISMAGRDITFHTLTSTTVSITTIILILINPIPIAHMVQSMMLVFLHIWHMYRMLAITDVYPRITPVNTIHGTGRAKTPRKWQKDC